MDETIVDGSDEKLKDYSPLPTDAHEGTEFQDSTTLVGANPRDADKTADTAFEKNKKDEAVIEKTPSKYSFS
ncbi:unnamed protein product [Echinostoma caproni]|uniref:Organ specific protein n=1 Tax=Echinostoma caproni TaxID=27848 RepID=A0A183AHE8_9TREM|nr:unnamed protein product [Echinostoma caproni]